LELTWSGSVLSETSTDDLTNRLLGRWNGRLDGDPLALDFAPDGRLACVIIHGNRRQTIMLTYRVEGDQLVTDQPSQPREERTKVEFVSDGLVLEFEGKKTHLTR
jgi:hypothetical protein